MFHPVRPLAAPGVRHRPMAEDSSSSRQLPRAGTLVRDPTTPAAELPQVGDLGLACGRDVQTTVVSAAQASRSSSLS